MYITCKFTFFEPSLCVKIGDLCKIKRIWKAHLIRVLSFRVVELSLSHLERTVLKIHPPIQQPPCSQRPRPKESTLIDLIE